MTLTPEAAQRLGQGLYDAATLHERQRRLCTNPLYELEQDYRQIYLKDDYQVGSPKDLMSITEHLSRENVYAVLGAALGDEGKGSVVDTYLQKIIPSVQFVYVTRFQGGSNAGHTVMKDGKSLALHQIPSVPFEVKAVGILDSQMTIHTEELMHEYNYIENIVGIGSLKDRLIVSRDALLDTDLERAQEVLDDFDAGKPSPTTKRGIGPTTAGWYTHNGLQIKDLLADDWRDTLGKRYDKLERTFRSRKLSLKDTDVADYAAILAKTGKTRKLGSKKEYLARLEATRAWLIEKDLVKHTYPIHMDIYAKVMAGQAGHIFEGAQALGLNPWLGTLKDTTSTNTGPGGILESTKVWQVSDIKRIIGVFKATYTSSVGSRIMPTQVRLDKKILTERAAKDKLLSHDEVWAAWVRETAKEYGTTTGRARDICFIDLPMLAYNCYQGNINLLAATHLDIARADEPIKVCAYYTNADNKVVGYEPGLDYLAGYEPHYIYLDGWDGEAVKRATSFDELPENAKKYLAFIQARVGVPIIFSKTGPDRENKVDVPELPEQLRVLTPADEAAEPLLNLHDLKHRQLANVAQIRMGKDFGVLYPSPTPEAN